MAGGRADRIGTADRGQTPQDFALGAGLFIIAVGFTFAFIPTAFLFTGADPGPTEIKQADRTSTAVISNLSVGHRQNTLDSTATAEFFNETKTEAEIQDAFELPSTARINLTIRALHDDAIVATKDGNGVDVRLAAGTDYPTDRPAAEVVRIINMPDEQGVCNPVCQLVVRVW